MHSTVLALSALCAALVTSSLWWWYASVTWQRRAIEADSRNLALEQEVHRLRADALAARARSVVAANRREE